MLGKKTFITIIDYDKLESVSDIQTRADKVMRSAQDKLNGIKFAEPRD